MSLLQGQKWPFFFPCEAVACVFSLYSQNPFSIKSDGRVQKGVKMKKKTESIEITLESLALFPLSSL